MRRSHVPRRLGTEQRDDTHLVAHHLQRVRHCALQHLHLVVAAAKHILRQQRAAAAATNVHQRGIALRGVERLHAACEATARAQPRRCAAHRCAHRHAARTATAATTTHILLRCVHVTLRTASHTAAGGEQHVVVAAQQLEPKPAPQVSSQRTAHASAREAMQRGLPKSAAKLHRLVSRHLLQRRHGLRHGIAPLLRHGANGVAVGRVARQQTLCTNQCLTASVHYAAGADQPADLHHALLHCRAVLLPALAHQPHRQGERLRIRISGHRQDLVGLRGESGVEGRVRQPHLPKRLCQRNPSQAVAARWRGQSRTLCDVHHLFKHSVRLRVKLLVHNICAARGGGQGNSVPCQRSSGARSRECTLAPVGVRAPAAPSVTVATMTQAKMR